jgi:AcrR family transcriptional regulator
MLHSAQAERMMPSITLRREGNRQMVRKQVSRRVNRRKAILQAAERLMLSHGLSGVTTRQISQEAGCSEGALYVHFNGRLDLLLAMLEESLPKMLGPLQILQQQIGRGSAQENLAVALSGIYRFHQRVTPLAGGLFAEPALLAAYRASLARQGKGPHLSMMVLQNYIAAEQRLGRIDPRVDPKVAAYLLMSASFFRAFSEQSFGGPMKPAWSRLVKQLIAAVVPAVDTK